MFPRQGMIRSFLWMALVLVLVFPSQAAKSLKNLRVSCRNQVYQISDVATIEDLINRLQKTSGIPASDMKNCKVVYRGKVLEPRKESLSKCGVQNGANLICITENYRMKGQEFLALLLDMTNDKSIEQIGKLWKQLNLRESLEHDWKELMHMQRQDVADAIRNSLDASYHSLRRAWEHPHFRQTLSDPNRIEGYRKVVATFMSKKLLQDFHPTVKRAVQSPEEWRKQVLKLTSTVMRLGDVLLDGLLEIVLDVLKGAGRSAAKWRTPDFPHTYEPTMEDPSVANELLFELSESDDE